MPSGVHCQWSVPALPVCLSVCLLSPGKERIEIRSDIFTSQTRQRCWSVTLRVPQVNSNWAGHEALTTPPTHLACAGYTPPHREKDCSRMSRGIYLIFTVLIASCHWSPVAAINHGVVDGGAGGGGGGTDENGTGAALFKLRSELYSRAKPNSRRRRRRETRILIPTHFQPP